MLWNVIKVILIIFAIPASSTEVEDKDDKARPHVSSYVDDLKYLCFNKSYVFSTLGYTCVMFYTCVMAWWAPTFIQTSIMVMEINKETQGISIDE